MPNIPITMSKLRTIIRLYEDRRGLKTIAEMARTRNTVKKYVSRWNSLSMSYEEFERLAEHYGAAVSPARTRKPKDKSHVKNTVKLIYKDIFTALNGLHCPDMPL